VVLVDVGDFLVDLSSHILGLVIILFSAEDSESLDESFEELTAVSSFCARLVVVLIDNGDILLDSSDHILESIILLISSEDSESLDENFEELTAVSSFCSCLIVVLIRSGGVFVDSSAHILDPVIILICSSEHSESFDEIDEELAVLLLKDLVKSLTIFFEDEDFVAELFFIFLGT